MKFLYSVQRYGEGIVGGSETACRRFAEQLVKRGHDVTVVTSCAVNYVDWSDSYSPGESKLNGVRIVRLPVVRTRDVAKFSELSDDILEDPTAAGYGAQISWLREMGPVLRNHDSVLRSEARNADVAIFMTYLYPTSVFGVASVAGILPTLLQPTAHEEPPAHLQIYRALFHQVHGLLFLTEEERRVAERIFHVRDRGVVTGLGMEIPEEPSDGSAFRSLHGLGSDPYILYLGRVDVFKGVAELMRYFVEYKGRNPSNLRLVLAGEAVMDIPSVDDIRHVGFLDEEMKKAAIAGATVFVMPSPFESFSIVLCEAWLQERPVMVQGRSEVLVGQCGRSGGGIPYAGFAEFEAALDLLLEDRELATEMGKSGREYVVATYTWDIVIERFMEEVAAAIGRFSVRGGEEITSSR